MMETFTGHKFWVGLVVGIAAYHFLSPIFFGSMSKRTG